MFRWTYRPPEIWQSGILRGPGGSLAAVAVGHKVYSFGKSGHLYNVNSQICVYIFNTVALCWRKLPPVTTGMQGERPAEVPGRHTGHSAVLVENIVYIWGDKHTQLYAFDVDTHRWLKTEVSGSVPEARQSHSACVLGKVMYIHGGRTNTFPLGNNDTYKLDTTTMVWSLINTRGAPTPVSSEHSATVIGTKIFVFGGWGGQSAWTLQDFFAFGRWGHPQVQDYNNIRVFDTETNCWLSMTPSTQLLQESRHDHSAFAYNGELYVFCCHETFNDLWKFNRKTLSWKKVEPKGKGPSKMSDKACCMVGDCVILFSRDMYILDLSPSMKTLCKVAVIQYGLEQSELRHDIRWELGVPQY